MKKDFFDPKNCFTEGICIRVITCLDNYLPEWAILVMSRKDSVGVNHIRNVFIPISEVVERLAKCNIFNRKQLIAISDVTPQSIAVAVCLRNYVKTIVNKV